MQPADGRPTVVIGATLSEAFKKVRQQFGPEAVISGSRTGTRRKSSGWGAEKVVEVMVETGGPRPRPADARVDDLTDEIRLEVERLEMMVQDICQGETTPADGIHPLASNPLAGHLVDNGASDDAVDKLLTRYAVETGRPRTDRPGILAWLIDCLATGRDKLDTWEGNHVFLGEHSADRLDFVLHLARRVTERHRRTLVISVLPDPERDEARLKNVATDAGFDAAVVRDAKQLPDMLDHLDGYDLVLLDLPALTDPRLQEGEQIHRWLASNEKLQRHLMMPLDRDFLDLDDLRDSARTWNCDWLVLTRLDGTRRAAKILDLIDRIPLPVSIMAENAVGEGVLTCATSELLLDRILAADTAPRFTPGFGACVLPVTGGE